MLKKFSSAQRFSARFLSGVLPCFGISFAKVRNICKFSKFFVIFSYENWRVLHFLIIIVKVYLTLVKCLYCFCIIAMLLVIVELPFLQRAYLKFSLYLQFRDKRVIGHRPLFNFEKFCSIICTFQKFFVSLQPNLDLSSI